MGKGGKAAVAKKAALNLIKYPLTYTFGNYRGAFLW